MRFEFATASRIVFGPGTFAEVGSLAREFGRNALVVTGRSPERVQPLRVALFRQAIETTPFSLDGEPTVERVALGVQQARACRCEFVIGLGGGSALDAAKAIAALLTNDGNLLDYLEVVGRGQPILRSAAPCLAIPTTAGTGTEVTRNAVLASPRHQVKASLRSPFLLPRVALIDPELTYSLPPAITATTGMDALTQLIEPYVSVRAQPMTDGFCVEGLRRVAASLRRVFADGRDPGARQDMALASLLGGLALANAGLGAVHGFAAPIGGQFPAPHGAVCAALLPQVMEVNLRAARARATSRIIETRYEEIARLLTGNGAATADDGVRWVRQLADDLEIPPLRTHGIGPQHISTLVPKAALASSMKGNPITLTAEEMAEILSMALDGV
jgi:alcohol dehydrogenase class IV